FRSKGWAFSRRWRRLDGKALDRRTGRRHTGTLRSDGDVGVPGCTGRRAGVRRRRVHITVAKGFPPAVTTKFEYPRRRHRKCRTLYCCQLQLFGTEFAFVNELYTSFANEGTAGAGKSLQAYRLPLQPRDV